MSLTRRLRRARRWRYSTTTRTVRPLWVPQRVISRRRQATLPLAFRPAATDLPRRHRSSRRPSLPPVSCLRPAPSRPATPRPARGWGRLRCHRMSRNSSQLRSRRRRTARTSRRRRRRCRPSVSSRRPRRFHSARLAAPQRNRVWPAACPLGPPASDWGGCVARSKNLLQMSRMHRPLLSIELDGSRRSSRRSCGHRRHRLRHHLRPRPRHRHRNHSK
jgi:hypothetical protein